MEAILKVKDLSKQYENGDISFWALKNINLEIEAGEFISIVGPSGCGKSTLLYLLGGLDEPESGEIYINHKNIASYTEKEKGKLRREEIGFIFQFYNLVRNLTLRENILLPLTLSKKLTEQKKKEASELIELIGLKGKEHQLPKQLSGGQQQRVAIARAVISGPQLILADEPIGNLDTASGENIMKLFKKINQEKAITVVQVTHSKEAVRYGNRIIHMRDGKIEAEETVS